jgi:hypothetical protein
LGFSQKQQGLVGSILILFARKIDAFRRNYHCTPGAREHIIEKKEALRGRKPGGDDMEIQALGPRALLVYADARELLRRGVDLRRPEPEALLHLSWEALARRGIPLQRLRELTALPGKRSLLLLLGLTPPQEEWFPFPDLSLAVDAVAALPGGPEGALVWQEGQGYLLGTRSPGQAALLSEFAAPLPPEEAEGLEEDAALILDEAALSRLWNALHR